MKGMGICDAMEVDKCGDIPIIDGGDTPPPLSSPPLPLLSRISNPRFSGGEYDWKLTGIFDGGVGVNEFPLDVEYKPLGFGELTGDVELGFIRFSFCLLLQNQTLTTSFSMQSPSATKEISSDVGLGLL